MLKNKSPGSDGLSVEFFQKFWPVFGRDYVEMINEIFNLETMSPSQRQAILTLLYKDGEKEKIGNWRPISLLNTDYKILTKAIANRLRDKLKTIIHPDQTCGIKGRLIFENIIFTKDAIFYANKNNKPLAVISIDQSKAFDRVNRNYLLKTLQKFGFGNNFIKWIKIIYTNTTSAICTNGHVSRTFLLTRGVRQGCPLSPLLYIIVAETMANAIRLDDEIQGFELPNNYETKLKCYADDTLVFLGDIKSISALFRLLDKYGKASESKLNVEKSKAMLTGTLKGSNEKNNCSVPLIFTDKLKVLGVWVGNGLVDVNADNWDKVMEKIQNALNMWKMRNLSVFGRALIVKSLALSKLWYISRVEIMEQEKLNDVEKKINEFIWYGKKQLVSTEKCKLDRLKGGLGLTDIATKCRTMRLQWLWKIYGNDNIENNDWRIMGRHFIDHVNQTVDNIEVSCIHMSYYKKSKHVPYFYIDLVETWKDMKFERKELQSRRDVLSEPLWSNPLIKFNGHLLNEIKWILAGLNTIKDIWSEDNLNFIDRVTMRNKIYTVIPTVTEIKISTKPMTKL